MIGAKRVIRCDKHANNITEEEKQINMSILVGCLE